MKTAHHLLQDQKDQLNLHLEETLYLLYRWRTLLQLACPEDPDSMRLLLRTWIQLQQQHYRMQSLFKFLLYETKLTAKSVAPKRT